MLSLLNQHGDIWFELESHWTPCYSLSCQRVCMMRAIPRTRGLPLLCSTPKYAGEVPLVKYSKSAGVSISSRRHGWRRPLNSIFQKIKINKKIHQSPFNIHVACRRPPQAHRSMCKCLPAILHLCTVISPVSTIAQLFSPLRPPPEDHLVKHRQRLLCSLTGSTGCSGHRDHPKNTTVIHFTLRGRLRCDPQWNCAVFIPLKRRLFPSCPCRKTLSLPPPASLPPSSRFLSFPLSCRFIFGGSLGH